MAATVHQISSAATAARSSGISRPTSLGDVQILTVGTDLHHQKKTAKTKRNELKLVLNVDKDEKKEEKMVRQLLTEGSEAKDITLSSLPVTTVGSVSTAAGDNSAAPKPSAYPQPVNQNHQPPIRFCRAEDERRSHAVLRNYLQREAVVKAWHDEQSKVTQSMLCF
jgi:hypothetical protein